MLDRARVREVFSESAELPVEQVAGFLDLACGADSELRAEVESLLAAAARRPAFLRAPTATVAGMVSRAPGEAPGTRIGHYRLVQEIGQGGFGSVYAAEQSEPVQRSVAVKIIKLGMDTRAVIARFENERQALAMMDHAHIARVYDAGATESGRPYFVMELVNGDPITTYCDRNTLSIHERLGVFMQVCRAVQHAHSKGVIHRDIKPGNVLVVTQDRQPHAKVIDFGIAKATQQGLAGKTFNTDLRQLVGTPEYMSPEQAEGSPGVDTRSDVYSLGVLLYELLTGATPFDPTTLRSAAFGEVLRIIREVEPLKPSTRVSTLNGSAAQVASQRRTEPGRLSPLLRGDLDWIVMRCIEKDPTRRYATADALAADLEAFLRGDPVSAVPPTALYRARKFATRNRGLMASVVAVMGALLLGIAGTTFGMIQARDAEGRAERARDRATTVRDFLTRTFQGVAPQVARGRNTELLSSLMDRAAARIDSGELAGDAEAERELRVVIGETCVELARYDDARRVIAPLAGEEDLEPGLSIRLRMLRGDLAIASSDIDGMEREFAEALVIANQHPSTYANLRVGVLDGLARAAAARNAPRLTTERSRQAVEAARALAPPDHQRLAMALCRLGSAFNTEGLQQEALGAWEEALRELDTRASSSAEEDSLLRTSVLTARAGLYSDRMDLAPARRDLDEAFRIAGAVLPPTHYLMLNIRNARSRVSLHSGRYADALSELGELLTLQRTTYGPDCLDSASTLTSIAHIHYMSQDWPRALEAGVEAERVRQKHLSPEACAADGGWTIVAESLQRLGRTSEALAIAERSAALQQADLPPENETALSGRYTLMESNYAAGDFLKAAEVGRDILAICDRQPSGFEFPLYFDVTLETACALLDHGDASNAAEAERLLRRSVEDRQSRFGSNSYRTQYARLELGRAIVMQIVPAASTARDAGSRNAADTDLRRFAEAESLIAPHFQCLVDNIGRLDASFRKRRVRDAAQSLIDLFDEWHLLNPAAGKGQLAREWRERLDTTLKSMDSAETPAIQK